MENTIIKEIHNQFLTSGEMLLLKANEQLSKSKNKSHKKKIKQLEELGFTNFIEAKELKPEEIKKANKLKELIAKYKVAAPQYSFMTDDRVTEVCKYFGLIQAPVSLYTHNIPDSNKEDILKFKIKDESLLERYVNKEHPGVLWRTKGGEMILLTKMGNGHLVNTINSLMRAMDAQVGSIADKKKFANMVEKVMLFVDELIDRLKRDIGDGKGHLEIEGILAPDVPISQLYTSAFIYTNISSGLRAFVRPHEVIDNQIVKSLARRKKKEQGRYKFKPIFHIVAPKHMIDLKDQVITKDFRAVPKEEKHSELDESDIKWFIENDPIVQAKVKGGWLNITAWGAEASIEGVSDHLN